MSQTAASSGTAGAGPRVCTACPLLCDDIRLTGTVAEGCCAQGAASCAAASSCPTDAAEGWIGGVPTSREAAIHRAAAVVGSARRVLVTGLAAATLEAITRACDVAETVGAAIDAGASETSQAAGPTVVRIGAVTAEWEEIRDRADLVVFWFCDPATTHPRFLERFVPPTAAGKARRTIAVGPAPVLPAGPTHLHVHLPESLAVATARTLEARQAGRGVAPAADDRCRVACDTLTAAVDEAACIAFVTGLDATDDVGLRAWSAAGFVRTIARTKPAFQVPLAAGVHAGGGNVAGVAAICTWRYGAAGAIARADRRAGEFLPGESDARHLIRRREVDCVVVVGDLPPALEKEIASARDGLTVVRLTAACGPVAAGPRDVQLRCVSPWIFPAGAMLREDGRHVALGSDAEATRPDSLASLLTELAARIRHETAGPRSGGVR